MDIKEFHKQMIAKQGTLETVNKTIQEYMEYVEALRDFKILCLSGDVDSHEMKRVLDRVQEEGVDSSVMRERNDILFNFMPQELELIKKTKINRTIERYLK